MRTIDATLKAALAAGNGSPIIRARITINNVNFLNRSVLAYELGNLTLTARIVIESGDTWWRQPYIDLSIERGLLIDGTEYVERSSRYFVRERALERNNVMIVQAHLFASRKVSTPSDIEVDGAMAIAIGQTSSVYFTNSLVWKTFPIAFSEWYKDIQFMPTGQTLDAENADTLHHLLRQKYLTNILDWGKDNKVMILSSSSLDAYADANGDYPAYDLVLSSSNLPQFYRQFRPAPVYKLYWKDEADAEHTLGTSGPVFNLGFIPSTVTPYISPYNTVDGHIKATLSPPNLELQNGDFVSIDGLGFCVKVKEVFQASAAYPWRTEIESLYEMENLVASLKPKPAAVDRIAESIREPHPLRDRSFDAGGPFLEETTEELILTNYQPLHSGSFINKLSVRDNNIQRAFETLDDHTHTANPTTEEVQDIVGAMLTSNTETGIAVTYQDSDGTIDFEVTPAGVGAIPESGWQARTETWTRTANHTFTVVGDETGRFRKGTKIRYKDGGGYEYGVVESSSYAAGNTTITLITNTDYGMAAATITDKYISYIENPEGFPHWFTRTATGIVTGSGGSAGSYAQSIGIARWRTSGNTISEDIQIRISNVGSWTGTVLLATAATMDANGGASLMNGGIWASAAAPGTLKGGPLGNPGYSVVAFASAMGSAFLQWSGMAANDELTLRDSYQF
jgi:hypothetical protein